MINLIIQRCRMNPHPREIIGLEIKGEVVEIVVYVQFESQGLEMVLLSLKFKDSVSILLFAMVLKLLYKSNIEFDQLCYNKSLSRRFDLTHISSNSFLIHEFT